MKKMMIKPEVKNEEDLHPEFREMFTSRPGGDTLKKCIQCGTCSATCPLSIHMDYTPRKVIAMLREGFRDEILESFTIWLCASCYSCTVQCPKNIKITDFMYNLKREAIKQKAYPRRFPVPVLAREFFHIVEKNGRMSEGPVIMRMYMKTNPFSHMKKAVLGLKLMLKGRIGFFGKETIKDRKQLRKLLAAMDKGARVLSFQQKETS